MEDVDRSELRKLQKEEERERRRLRDRQRRQSMSVEEREKHLARRRRNYQLRRLRAENSKLDSEQTQSEQITHQILALPSASSDLDVDVGSHQVGTKFESEFLFISYICMIFFFSNGNAYLAALVTLFCRSGSSTS